MSAATHRRLLEIEEVFVKEIASAERLIAAVSAERDAALSGARTAERRLIRGEKSYTSADLHLCFNISFFF